MHKKADKEERNWRIVKSLNINLTATMKTQYGPISSGTLGFNPDKNNLS